MNKNEKSKTEIQDRKVQNREFGQFFFTVRIFYLSRVLKHRWHTFYKKMLS